jgi:hypothetical protein
MTFWREVGGMIVIGVVCVGLVGLFALVIGLVVHFLDKLDGI